MRLDLSVPVLGLFVPLLASSAAAQCGWSEDGFLTPSSGYGGTSQYFGRSISLDANLAAIGAPGLDGASGNTLVFELVGGAWIETASLAAQVPQSGDDFGRAVSASQSLNGESVLIGAPGWNAGAGTAFFFERMGASWVETQLVSPDPLTTDSDFGRAVALGGEIALVGAPGDQTVHVFERLAGLWTRTAVLTPPGDAEEFGQAVAFDGATALIGAPDAGEVHVFLLDAGGWTASQVLLPGPGIDGKFGEVIALDGTRAMVGSPDDSGQGTAHVFDVVGGSWTETAALTPPASSWLDEFGASVGLSGDNAVVGAPADEEGLGLAHVYQFDGAVWQRVDSLAPGILDPQDQEGQFGAYAGVYGSTIMVSIGLDETPFFGALGDSYAGAVDVWTPATSGCANLFGVPNQVSVGQGGTQKLYLDAGPDEAGKLFLTLGSLAGTTPGLPFGGFQIPLNQDAYLNYTLTQPGAAPLTGSFGTLSSSGVALVAFGLVPGAGPSLAGLTVDHAFVVIDPSLPSLLTAVSNSTPVSLVP